MGFTINIRENEAYHADTTHISKSGLDLINKAPAKYYERYLNEESARKEPTEAMIIGSAFHCLVLEPTKFNNEFFIIPEMHGKGSVNSRQKMIIDNPGKHGLSVADYAIVSKMRDSIMNHPVAKELFTSGFAEKRFNWTDKDTGAKCKIKPDWYSQSRNACVDLKTTDDAREDSFGRSAYKYRYHVQAPFYNDGLIENGIHPDTFIFISVEKEPPYLVNVFYISKEDMQIGREIYKNDLLTYTECLKSGIWPGYGNDITKLKLPNFIHSK